jgi:hypothetical protein
VSAIHLKLQGLAIAKFFRKSSLREFIMFDYTSRYYNLETAKLTMPDGRIVAYVKRRFLPQGKNMLLLEEVSVTEGDRLDQITARTLGDPLQFWQVCDANNAMNPVALTAEIGQKIRIPMPQI